MTTGTLVEIANHLEVPYEPLRKRVQRSSMQPVATRWDGKRRSAVYRADQVAQLDATHRRATPTRLHQRLTQA